MYRVVIYFLANIFVLVICSQNLYEEKNSDFILCPKVCSCDFQIVNCSNQNLSDLFFQLPKITEILYLSHNNFHKLPENLRHYEDLISLTMAYNGISDLYMEILQRCKKLEYLDLSFNKFTTWNNLHLDLLLRQHDLKYLNIASNWLSNTTNEFDTLHLRSSTLEVLNFRNCGITFIRNKNIISELLNLNTLILAENSITWFSQLASKSLETLDLSKSQLHHIRSNAFLNLPSLRVLILNDNDILQVYGHTKPSSNTLQELHMRNCNLDLEFLTEFPNLTKVYMTGNRIRTLNENSFEHNPHLSVIDLSGTSLVSIHINTFKNLSKLSDVNLAENSILDISPDTFKFNRFLKILNLSRNRLQYLNKLESDSLMKLDVSHCELVGLTSKNFENLPSLKYLDLSYNPIKRLPEYLESKSLIYLNLANCNLGELSEKTFVELTSLKFLFLSGNRLYDGLKPDMFPKSLLVIKLDNNWWICDCHSKDFRQFYNYLRQTPSKVDDLNTLRCNFPKNVSGDTWAYACRKVWYHTPDTRLDRLWMTTIIILLSICILFCLIRTVRRMILDRQEMQRVERQRLAEAARQRICLLTQRHREAQLNAPDPRDLQAPPSYEEALSMSRPNLADLRLKRQSTASVDQTNENSQELVEQVNSGEINENENEENQPSSHETSI